jgi:carbon monoxide dehydrogenase subunit G
MPTFSSSDKRTVTIQATQDQVAEALTVPERIERTLADELESSTKVDAHTVRWIRKPVEEKGVRFRADYVVHYEYDGRGTVTWRTVGAGNMRSNGEAKLAPAPDGGTRVELSESIECDMDVNRILAAVLRPIVERRIKSGVGDYLAKVKAGLEGKAS